MLYDEADFHIMRPHLEALYYLGTLYVDSDVMAQDYETARWYFERAEYQGHANARVCLDFVLLRLHGERQRRKTFVQLQGT